MTAIATLVGTLAMLPVELYLVRLGAKRVRAVYPPAGAVIALPSILALFLAAVVVLLGVLVGLALAATGFDGLSGSEAALSGFAVVYGLGSFMLPLAHVGALAGAGLGLVLLVVELQGSELDERAAAYEGETLR